MTAKLPMAIAAQNLERICEAIDEGELNEALQSLFTDTRLDLVDAIDRRIYFLELAKDRVKTLKRLRDEFSEAAKRVEYAVERVKEGTKQIMETYPDLPYKGDLGRLRIQKNSAAKISLPEIKTTEASVRNVIDVYDIRKHEIGEEYYEVHSYYTLLIDEIKKAIEAGEEIPWAKLDRGSHLRISR